MGHKNLFSLLLRYIFVLIVIIFGLVTVVASGGGDGGGSDNDDNNSSGDSSDNIASTISGQALLGPLCGATVMLYKSTDLQNAIYTTITNDSADLASGGTFDIPLSYFEDDILYIIVITGGNDIDSDDDGIIDTATSNNHSPIHIAALGSELQLGNFTVNILTDLVYNQVSYLLLGKYPQETILTEMDVNGRDKVYQKWSFKSIPLLGV